MIRALLILGTLFAQQAQFEEGNSLYQQGSYEEAIEKYSSVLADGFESADLYYNLGNSYFKIGDLGRSVLFYERALRIGGSDPDVIANLELVRSLAADEIEPMSRFWGLRVMNWWMHLLPTATLTVVVVIAYLVATGALVARIISSKHALQKWGTRLAILFAGVTVILGGAALALTLLPLMAAVSMLSGAVICALGVGVWLRQIDMSL